MSKPATLSEYQSEHTADCERVLVTLFRGLGPWKNSVCLIGGLTPRYLVKRRPPDVPPHAGTMDVDVVIDLQILANTEAYQTLEENLKNLGFERAENENGQKQSWRWHMKTEHGALMVLEFLAYSPDTAGGKVEPLPTKGRVSALNIPHSSMVFDLHEYAEISAELMGGNGVVTENIKHANLVGFTCLKALAFVERYEKKDAHDLIYCLEHTHESLEIAATHFKKELEGKHGDILRKSLEILRTRFTTDATAEGYLKDGPIAVAKFELGEGDEEGLREARALRQRQASDIIQQLLAHIG